MDAAAPAPAPAPAATAYLAVLLGALVLLAAGVMAFCWWSDPYGIHRGTGIKVTSLVQSKARLFKAHDCERQPSDALLAGTSRVEQALDPAHPAIAAGGWKAYNVALPGASIYEERRMIEHAHAVHGVRQVWLELAPFMFGHDRPRLNIGFSEARLAVAPDGRRQPLRGFTDVAETLWALEAFEAGLRCLRTSGSGQRAPVERIFMRGMADQALLLKELSHSRELFRINAGALWAACYRSFALADPEGRAPACDDLAALFAFCRAEGIALTVFFAPEHAYLAWGNRVWGVEGPYEDAKRLVLRLARDDVPVWDFAGVHPWTTEPVPPTGSDADMTLYMDAGHYTPVLGRRVLDTLLAGEPREGFGVRLTAATIEGELAAQRTRLTAWAAAHPELAAEVEAVGKR